MIFIRDPISYSFHSWMNQSPFSGHPLGMNRFYKFAKTVAKSRKKNDWHKKQYFISQVCKYYDEKSKR